MCTHSSGNDDCLSGGAQLRAGGRDGGVGVVVPCLGEGGDGGHFLTIYLWRKDNLG